MEKGETKLKKNFKRILSLIIINVMLISLFAPYSSVFAEVNVLDLNISTPATKLEANQEITVEVTATQDIPVQIAQIAFNIEYDTNVFGNLSKSSFDFSSNTTGADLECSSFGKVSDGKYNVIIADSNSEPINLRANDLFFKLNLNVTNNAAESTINFTSIEISDPDWNMHYPQNISGTLPKQAVTHKVTYNYETNGGDVSQTAIPEEQVAENSAIDLRPTAVKAGWDFVGWNTDPNAKTPLTSLNMDTNDVTLYAIFSKELTANCYYYNSLAESEGPVVVRGSIYNNETQVSVNLPTTTENAESYIDSFTNEWTPNGWTTDPNSTTEAGQAGTEAITLTEANSGINYYMLYIRDINIRYWISEENTGAPATQTGTVAINYSNPESIKSVKITVSNEIPTKDGNNFVNWNTTKSGVGNVYESNTEYDFTDDATLYAQWEAKEYTIKYNGNGNNSTDTAMADETYTYGTEGGKVLTANTYTKDGYEFKGWATAADATEKEYDNNAALTDENILGKAVVDGEGNNVVTLYAVWEAKTYTIHFDGNGATEGTIEDQSYVYGSEDKLKQNQYTKTGYDFRGWSLQSSTVAGSEEYADEASLSDIDILANAVEDENGNNVVTLYAVWEAKTYTIHFDGNGATEGTMQDSNPYTYGNGGITLNQNEYAKTGYHFAGWSTTLNGSVKFTDKVTIQDEDILENATEDGTITLYAVWEINKYTVEFIGKVNDGTPEGKDDVLKSVEVDYNSKIIPNRLGIDIDKLKETVVTPKYTYTVNETTPFNGDLTSFVTEDRKIYVNYNEPTINEYLVTFFEEDGKTELGKIMIPYGDPVDDTDIEVKTEDNTYIYNFIEWVDENRDPVDKITEEINLYAKYEKEYKNYEVKFIDDDGLISKKPDYHYGDSIIEPTNPTKQPSNGYEYEFKNWKDNEGNIVDFTNAIVEGDTTYIAVYDKKPIEYTITYINVEGVQNPNPAIYTVEDVDENGQINLQDLNNRKGSKFTGWYKEQEFTTKITSISIDLNDLGNITVYAKWEESLYLTSDKYKIGDKNLQKLDEYIDGDIYLYRVSPNTTLEDFIANCETNGRIKVYKQEENQLVEIQEDEIIGTGMILKDTLNEEEISLEIAVTGDLDGNGESDITDLVKVRRYIQELEDISGIYTKAGDINEDSEIDITDLVKIRRHIQEMEFIN